MRSVLAALLSGVTLCLAGCERAPSGYRIAFDAVAARYGSSGDAPRPQPTAEVNGVRRIVLADSKPLVLWSDVLPAASQATGDVRVDIPAPLRGTPLQIDMTRALFPLELTADNARALFSSALSNVIPTDPEARWMHPEIATEAPRAILTREATARMAYRFPDADPSHTALLVVTARAAQETSYTTDTVELPADARLLFGIGFNKPATGGAARVRFTVTVLADGGEQAVFETALTNGRDDAVWQEEDVDLGAYAKRSVRLRFETKAEADPPESATLVFPVWTEPRIVTPVRTSERRPPNVLLISLDTLRADYLGCYGHERPTSPAIDALAQAGALFTRAYAPYPQTAGSHMTLLTGSEPCVHRVLGASGGSLPSEIPTLAQLLRKQGWETAAFTEDGWINAATGFARGFGTYVENTDVGLAAGAVASTFARGMEWIRSRRGAPWFVFLHTYQTHAPYAPPDGYLARVAPAGANDDSSRYDGEIRYTDDAVASLLQFLDTAGLADHTIVVLTSDHGEHFGEHGLYGHDNSLFDELLHVPLIMRAPGLVTATRVTQPVGLIDVVPTLLDLLHLPPSPRMQGRSLVPLLQGRDLPVRPLFAWWSPGSLVSIRQPDGRKWIIDEAGGRAQLFFLPSDPAETQNVAMRTPSWQLDEARAAAAARCVAPAAPPDAAREAVPLDPRVREKLRALGYLH